MVSDNVAMEVNLKEVIPYGSAFVSWVVVDSAEYSNYKIPYWPVLGIEHGAFGSKPSVRQLLRDVIENVKYEATSQQSFYFIL